MALNVRHPIWLQAAGAPGATSFALLFSLESLTRAIIASVVPLQVLTLVGDPKGMSLVYFVVSGIGLLLNFSVPLLVRLISRRWTYSLGAIASLAAALLLAGETLVGSAAGMLLRVFGTACFSICLNLYILDYLKRRELNRMEPVRLLYAATAWTVGPALGVFLWTRVDHAAPYLISAACALLLLGYFWFLRASDDRAIVRARSPAPNPFLNIRRFFAQPRLRLGWLIAFTRSAWWAMYFIYVPVFAVEAGLGAEVGGLLVSAGNGMLFLAPVIGRVVERRGVRWTIVCAFLVGGSVTLAAALAMPFAPALAALLLVCAAVASMSLDVSGNLPFLRSVRPSQRAGMTTVFVTYRDFSEVAPPGVFALILTVLPLPFVFVASAASYFAGAWYARHVPRRM
ncbi:MAG: MFS transporter [Tistlia sp.]|uniref:MFS transporter n=1 Tax=Tistlia sp. TaxID=3057121 RepID=UPI0034A4714E